MAEDIERKKRLGTMVSVGVILAALLSLGIVVAQTVGHPRTDDAEVFANFIGMAPQVEGPILQLHVKDNQQVHKGDLLFSIDDRPYQYALQRALSEKEALEAQIRDEQRKINAQVSAVAAARANTENLAAGVMRSQAVIQQGEADVNAAKAGVAQAEAELAYATSNLNRLVPLLAKQYVTPDQVEQARTSVASRQQGLQQAKAQLLLAQARLEAAHAGFAESRTGLQQGKIVVTQTQQSVLTIDPLLAQRGARVSAVLNAQYNLQNCKIYAPFDARVTDLNISEGAYAHTGQQIFTLIDTRTWWVVANYRETQMKHIVPGMSAEVYVMSRPGVRYHGVVESAGFGVQPDPDRIGRLAQGLPDIQRTLNWVHLATRYPVRIRIDTDVVDPFRIGESAVVIVRGQKAEGYR